MIFGYYLFPVPILSIRIFLSSNTGSGNVNNLKGGPYYIFQKLTFHSAEVET